MVTTVQQTGLKLAENPAQSQAADTTLNGGDTTLPGTFAGNEVWREVQPGPGIIFEPQQETAPQIAEREVISVPVRHSTIYPQFDNYDEHGNPLPEPVQEIPPAAVLTPGAVFSREHLIESSVRIRIPDSEGVSKGTGTIVYATGSELYVLTCGHLFRESNGTGPISVDFWDDISASAPGVDPQVTRTLPAELVNYDLEYDMAVLRIHTNRPVTVAPIAAAGTRIAPGDSVASVGCGNGDPPEFWESQVRTINRYQGKHNIEVTGAPVEGRSGGGLFNARGELIGICFASSEQDNEGLYLSVSEIQNKLTELKLGWLYGQSQ